MLCARCHLELGTAAASLDRPIAGPRLQETERNARELLARWSTQNLLEPASSIPAPSIAQTPAEPVRPARRADAAHTSVPTPKLAASIPREDVAKDDAPASERPRKKNRRPRLAPVHDDVPAAPIVHDEVVRNAVQQAPPPQSNWTTMIGQLCAYGGVALLTLGTVMVLSGYFGGPTEYAPTGWLVSAVGQMLLFLGVVTLVSGGMEQTIDEVAWRIDYLADQIAHMEKTITAQQLELERERRRAARRNRSSRRDQSDAA
jgi:hypothetical protein